MEGPGVRTVIQQVLDVEGQAREIVSEAEKRAREILKGAHDEAERLIESAKHAAVEQVHKESLQTIEAAEKQRDARVAEEMKNDAAIIERSKLKLPQAVEQVARELLGQ